MSSPHVCSITYPPPHLSLVYPLILTSLSLSSPSQERALYCFESSFHILFNYTQANCRLDYSRAENRCSVHVQMFMDQIMLSLCLVFYFFFRSFFLTLFHHLSYVGRRGKTSAPGTDSPHTTAQHEHQLMEAPCMVLYSNLFDVLNPNTEG